MNECELTVSITALAEGLSKNLTDDELYLLSAVVLQFGDTLSTILAYRSICSK